MVKAVLIPLTIFLLGAIAGGAAVYARAGAGRAANITVEERADLLTSRLALRPEQRAEILSILRGHQAQVLASRKDLRVSVRRVLDGEQRERFDQLTGHPATEDGP